MTKARVSGTVGQRIFFARKRKELTQQALAKKIGVEKSRISKWETGRQAVKSHWRQLSEALDVTEEYLASGVTDPRQRARSAPLQLEGYWITHFRTRTHHLSSDRSIDNVTIEEIERDGDRYRGTTLSSLSSAAEAAPYEHDLILRREGDFVRIRWDNFSTSHLGVGLLSIEKYGRRMHGQYLGGTSRNLVESGIWNWCRIQCKKKPSPAACRKLLYSQTIERWIAVTVRGGSVILDEPAEASQTRQSKP